MKRSSLHAVLLITLLGVMVCACASVPLATTEMDLKAKSMTSPPDKALLYVSRENSFVGSGENVKVYVNGDYIGELHTNNYLVLLLDPGKHDLEIAGIGAGGNYSLDAKAGKSYYAFFTDVESGNIPIAVVPGVLGRQRMKSYSLVSLKGYANEFRTIFLKTPESDVVRPSAPAPADDARVVTSDIDVLPVTKIINNKNAFAVVIGIEHYRQKLPKADFATQDARLVADYLTKVLGFPEENVVTLLNDRATNVDFVKYFEKWLPNNVEKGSTVFIYYSGHGAPNAKTSDAYLVPYDGDPSFIDETGYSLKRMYAALGKLPAKQVIVALDSCFSGAGGRSVIAKGARPLVMNLKTATALPKNMTVLSASSGDQISSTYDEKGHGLFTYFMLKGIKNEDVTRPDGSLKLDDLFSYVKPQVERIARKQYNNEQTPQLIEPKKN